MSRGYVVFILFFFFKQKTAYEMRISDWSSDVCSSDLASFRCDYARAIATNLAGITRDVSAEWRDRPAGGRDTSLDLFKSLYTAVELEIGRASCRERVCQYV